MKKAPGILVLLLVASNMWGAVSPRSVLVFPFENQSGRADLNWISEGFAQLLASRMESPDRIVLGRREREAASRQLAIAPTAPLTLASVFKVAETLGADWAITGNFNVEGNRLTAHAQLLDLRGMRLAPALEASGELADLADLPPRLAWRMLATQDPAFTVGKEEDFQKLFLPVRLDAFENYIRGILATDSKLKVRFLSEADRLNPADHRAALELGRFYFEAKDYENSARWMRKLEDKDPNYPESLFFLGVDEFFLGNDAVAEKAFGELSGLIPLNEVWNNLGVLRARRKRYEDALSAFEGALKGDPADPVFNVNVGVTLTFLKRPQEAVRYLEEAVSLSPDDPEFHLLLAEAYVASGNAGGREREMRWLAAFGDTAVPDPNPDLLPHLRLKKNYDGRAYRLLALAIHNALEDRLQRESAAQHAEVHIVRGREFLRDHKLLEAEPELREAVSLLPNSSEAHLALAQFYEASGRHEDAAAEIESSLRREDSVAARVSLARVYLSMNRPEAARAQGRAALALDPTNREAQMLMARIPHAATSGEKKP
ncbi:MAG: tetratricopeptide repeat protein [Terriglobia bacterium]